MRERWLLTQVKSQASHSNLALTKALAWISQGIGSWRESGEVLEAWECFWFGEKQQPVKWGRRDIYRRAPKTSRYWVGTPDKLNSAKPRTPDRHSWESSDGGRNFLPLVGTPDPCCQNRIKCSSECFCLSWVVSISVSHFSMSTSSFHIPLNSTVFPVLKFKI